MYYMMKMRKKRNHSGSSIIPIMLISALALTACSSEKKLTNAEELVEWAKTQDSPDIGIHLTLTSEWKDYRWGPVSDSANVTGLIDPEGKMWYDVPDVVTHASAEEIETENLKSITDSWQQRVWEAQFFSDPVVKQFYEDNEIIITT